MVGGWAYLGAFAGTLTLALVLTPVALRVAQRRAILDRPGGYKLQESSIPYLGGVALVVAFAAVVWTAAWLGPPAGGFRELTAILGLGVGLSIMGLVDDLRGGLPPLFRLAVQIAAGIAVWTVGIRVGLFPSEALNAFVTVFWVVGVTNAFNLLDNMDGLSAGVAATAAGSFFLIAAINGQVLVASMAVALAGCALGFLKLNFHPARIYMGDAGSMFLGFVLAVLGIKLVFGVSGQATFLVPVLVLGVAIFDTALVTACRLYHGRHPLKGGRDHVSHRLLLLGLPVRVAVGLTYAVGVALGWLALIMPRVDLVTGLLIAGLLASVAALLGGLLAAVPVYDSSRHRHFRLQEVRLQNGFPKKAQRHLRVVSSAGAPHHQLHDPQRQVADATPVPKYLRFSATVKFEQARPPAVESPRT